MSEEDWKSWNKQQQNWAHVVTYSLMLQKFKEIPAFIKSIDDKHLLTVNNAGINNKDYFEFTADEFDTIVATQAKAPFILTQKLQKYMKKRRKGL